MSIGTKLKDLRIKHKRSLQEVADGVGASKAHIWEIERGGSKNPSIDLLSRIAEYFSVSVSYLIDEEPPSEEKDELIVLYRDLKNLDEKDREAVRSIMQRLKEKKDQG